MLLRVEYGYVELIVILACVKRLAVCPRKSLNNSYFGFQISRVSKMLADEYGTASNIKSRVNRLSVLGAITSVQHRLKLYTKVPPNGLVVYCGTVVTDEGKEKKVNIDFEPFKPINTSLYLCDNKFHTEALTALLADDNRCLSLKLTIRVPRDWWKGVEPLIV